MNLVFIRYSIFKKNCYSKVISKILQTLSFFVYFEKKIGLSHFCTLINELYSALELVKPPASAKEGDFAIRSEEFTYYWHLYCIREMGNRRLCVK